MRKPKTGASKCRMGTLGAGCFVPVHRQGVVLSAFGLHQGNPKITLAIFAVKLTNVLMAKTGATATERRRDNGKNANLPERV